MTYNIDDIERERIRSLYVTKNEINILKERLSKCRFSADGKRVLFENNVYYTETGELVPLTEAWSTSDILHTAADVASVTADFIFPGSGAIIDTLNGISYIIEAQFEKDLIKRNMLYVMAAITFAFVLIPGPLQAVAPVLKKLLKGGAMLVTPAWAIPALKIVRNNIDKISIGIGPSISRALKSPLAEKIVGKYGKKLALIVDEGVKNMKSAFDNVLGNPVSKKATKTQFKAFRASVLTPREGNMLTKFFTRQFNIRNGLYIMKKFGFVPGKKYIYVATKNGENVAKTIELISMSGNNLMVRQPGKKLVYAINVNTFAKGSFYFPWLKKGVNSVAPVFIKHWSRALIPDGSDLDYDYIENEMPTLDPDQTSLESMAYLHDDLAQYEGDSGTYTINPSVQAIQNALMLLGYQLPRFGADGKFGPETKDQLSRFQTDKMLDNSIGKMDRITATSLAHELRGNGIPNSEELQQTLMSI